MLSVSQALFTIQKLPLYGKRERLAVEGAVGLVLAADARAQVSHPPFPAAAMDGFALRAKDVAGASPSTPKWLPLCGDVPAGKARGSPLLPGTCLSISTGAMLPAGADCVAEKEAAQASEKKVAFFLAPAKGRHVRKKGEAFQRGDVLLPKGSMLTPFQLGLLHQGGVRTVVVHAPPKVALVSSGEEIAFAGEALLPGKVYDTSPALVALLEQDRAPVELCMHAQDNPQQLREALQRALSCDVVITVGGVSAGDHDLVRRTLAELGGREVFFKVNQKPGKPLALSQVGRATVFSLPGNPLSSLVCYWVYVRPFLQRWGGRSPSPAWQRGRLLATYERKGEQAHLLLARHGRGGGLRLLPRWRSHSLAELRSATALVYLGTQRRRFTKDTRVPYLPLSPPIPAATPIA